MPSDVKAMADELAEYGAAVTEEEKSNMRAWINTGDWENARFEYSQIVNRILHAEEIPTPNLPDLEEIPYEGKEYGGNNDA